MTVCLASTLNILNQLYRYWRWYAQSKLESLLQYFKQRLYFLVCMQIDLATCCLLIALEEEASVEVHPELKQTLMEQTQLP